MERANIDVFVDRRSIYAGEEWQRRIYDAIRLSDIIIFAMSPNSVTSEICRWEIEQSLRMDKRILPIVITELAPETVPSELGNIQWLFFTGPNASGRGFDENVAQLTSAIRADINGLQKDTGLARVVTLAVILGMIVAGFLGMAFLAHELVKQRAVSDRTLLFLSQHAPADVETLLCRLQTQRGLTEEESRALKSLVQKQSRQRCP